MKKRRFTALFLITMLASSLLTGCQDTNDNHTTESVVAERFSTEVTMTEPHSAETSTTETTTPETSTTKAATSEPVMPELSTAEAATLEKTTAEPATTETTATATTEAAPCETEPSPDIQFDCPTIIIPSVSPSCPTIEATTEAPEVPTTEENLEPETESPTTSAPIVSKSYSLDLAKEAFDILNQYRAVANLPALIWSDSLYESSKVRAKEIRTLFSHTRPDGTSCFTAFSSKWRGKGENIYYGTGHLGDNAEIAMTSWYNSDGHRANMLSKSFNHASIACYYENGAYYWVTLFGYK